MNHPCFTNFRFSTIYNENDSIFVYFLMNVKIWCESDINYKNLASIKPRLRVTRRHQAINMKVYEKKLLILFLILCWMILQARNVFLIHILKSTISPKINSILEFVSVEYFKTFISQHQISKPTNPDNQPDSRVWVWTKPTGSSWWKIQDHEQDRNKSRTGDPDNLSGIKE